MTTDTVRKKFFLIRLHAFEFLQFSKERYSYYNVKLSLKTRKEIYYGDWTFSLYNELYDFSFAESGTTLDSREKEMLGSLRRRSKFNKKKSYRQQILRNQCKFIFKMTVNVVTWRILTIFEKQVSYAQRNKKKKKKDLRLSIKFVKLYQTNHRQSPVQSTDKYTYIQRLYTFWASCLTRIGIYAQQDCASRSLTTLNTIIHISRKWQVSRTTEFAGLCGHYCGAEFMWAIELRRRGRGIWSNN